MTTASNTGLNAGSNTEAGQDPFHELRLYYVAPGRIDDMEARAENDLRGLFARHGVHPLGMWSVVAGPTVPVLAYLTPWQSMPQRTKSWAGFYADPEWASARTRTNAGGELVERYEVLLLRSVIDWQPFTVPDDHVGRVPVVEMVIQSVAVGRAADVRTALLEQKLPALRAAGATVHGVFDIMSGRMLPSIVYIISWPGGDKRFADVVQPAGGSARASTTAATGTAGAHAVPPLLDRADHYLMRTVPIAWF